MQDSAIDAFFEERKAAWLKKNLSTSMSELEVKEKEHECDSVFALKNWLPNAAKRAGQMSISTHPCTFSHPSARKNKNGYASAVIASSESKNDGFLRTGNVAVAADALGNAAALDVYKFLTLITDDGQSVLQHLEQDSELAQVLLTLPNVDEEHSYQALKQGFLAMSATDDEVITSSKIKQVYFPVSKQQGETDYHQLSLLTASGIVFELRQRLDNMRFGEEIKAARTKKKDGEYHSGFREIYDLTTIGYGGTKPQNISVLNNQNGGKAHLLMSVPPTIKNRHTHFPKVDFFQQSVNYFQCKEQFQQLHSLYKHNENNMHVRADRDELYQQIIDHLIEKMWQVRAIASEQYIETASQLSKAQTTWLCEHTKMLRETTDDWLDEIVASITTYLFYGYEKMLGKKAIKLGNAEYRQMEKVAANNKEALR
ncbi:type I-F CRISPR-associated protein Csy1 [Marinomonas sp. UCMA 3892]|uniref:type I-F CRISPR-associated protein Csy1 n=1 Tax=Marinomonas sp. UCMA 3892 TaxID=1972585 RepID=UPI00146A623E|nr:type I-F CRISPR-associated protein Csy1 [Marinomonas sp. UCMA 3892]NLU99863.1 type I-F CRISPR-associated protein Csy1 [Marinomonas sp. UCMA 3892]